MQQGERASYYFRTLNTSGLIPWKRARTGCGITSAAKNSAHRKANKNLFPTSALMLFPEKLCNEGVNI
jgi:hypothetical protein